MWCTFIHSRLHACVLVREGGFRGGRTYSRGLATCSDPPLSFPGSSRILGRTPSPTHPSCQPPPPALRDETTTRGGHRGPRGRGRRRESKQRDKPSCFVCAGGVKDRGVQRALLRGKNTDLLQFEAQTWQALRSFARAGWHASGFIVTRFLLETRCCRRGKSGEKKHILSRRLRPLPRLPATCSFPT